MIVVAFVVTATIAIWPERAEPAPRPVPELDLDGVPDSPAPVHPALCGFTGRWIRHDFDQELTDSVALVP